MTAGKEENDVVVSNQVFGLTGELALQGNMSKKAQQRLKKKLQKEKDEEET